MKDRNKEDRFFFYYKLSVCFYYTTTEIKFSGREPLRPLRVHAVITHSQTAGICCAYLTTDNISSSRNVSLS